MKKEKQQRKGKRLNDLKERSIKILPYDLFSFSHVYCIIVLLPHIGSASYETRLEMVHLTAKNVIAGLHGSKLPAPVWS